MAPGESATSPVVASIDIKYVKHTAVGQQGVIRQECGKSVIFSYKREKCTSRSPALMSFQHNFYVLATKKKKIKNCDTSRERF